jgi:Ca2+-transporting ATPase
MTPQWYQKEVDICLEALQSNRDGLSKEEAARRLRDVGENKLPESKTDGWLVIFLRQFKSPLIYVLLFAAMIVGFTGEFVDTLIIIIVLIFNAVVGTIQEGRAQNTLLKLRRFIKTHATVIRDGEEIIVPDTAIVPGDVIMIEEGEKIPADARLIDVQNFSVDESTLSGESTPISKITDPLSSNQLPQSDQKNMVFRGTTAVSGRARAVVVATGEKTVVGQITKTIAVIDTEIPLKKDIRALSRMIIIVVSVLVVVIFTIGLMKGKTMGVMFATVVSLAVSVIPEGLPVVITLILASGVYRMSKRAVLIRRLQAVEALGQAKVLAVDKTGTITRNEMMVEKLFAGGEEYKIDGNGYTPRGIIKLGNKIITPLENELLITAGRIAALISNARLLIKAGDKTKVIGDPTDAALLVFAQKIGFKRDELLKTTPLIMEVPFNYQNKFHEKIFKLKNRKLIIVAGAAEVILAHSNFIFGEDKNGKIKKNKLRQAERDRLLKKAETLSESGLRVIAGALATRQLSTEERVPPDNLIFTCLFAIRDPLRAEVKEALKSVRNAGMKVVMITGDHPATAKTTAREANIWREGNTLITGKELDKLDDEKLPTLIGQTTVFARVTPEHKLRIIKAFRKRGEIVAMTGDGVNDAPSLVAADLGVAMGKIGTEVAKEAADIVLLDDNFGNIGPAVEEGRNIYKTIKKVVLYLFSTSVGEILTIVGALLLNLPLPLLPRQIIWLNFVTDGFLTAALALEPKESGLLSGRWVRTKYLVDKLMITRIGLMATPMAFGSLFLFSKFYEYDLTKAATIALTTLAAFQWWNAWNCRSENKSILQMKITENKFLFLATITVIILQQIAVYTPFFQKILRTVPLSLTDWLIIILFSTTIILAEEIRKYFSRQSVTSAAPKLKPLIGK